MFWFHQFQPRRFRHEYIYVNERKERLRRLEEKARAELGKSSQPVSDREEIHRAFTGRMSHLRRRGRGGWKGIPLSTIALSVALIILFLLLLFY